jgi:hypothetical protein
MKTKEKAEDLVDKFYQTTPNEYFVNEPIGIKGRYKSWEQAKESALIAVNEILFALKYDMNPTSGSIKYWDEVKQEIENL